jgi:NADH-quinone oxidoreductase subunit M
VAGIVLGAAYMLWLYQRTMFGAVDNEKNQSLKDLNLREVMTLVPLVVWAFWIGLYPKPFFNVLEKPVSAIVERVNPDFFKAPPAQAATRPPARGVSGGRAVPAASRTVAERAAGGPR